MSLLNSSVRGMAGGQLSAQLKSRRQERGRTPPVPDMVQSSCFFVFFPLGGGGKGVAVSFLSITFILQPEPLPAASLTPSSHVRG